MIKYKSLADEDVLKNFYTSLISKGNLNWDINDDVCGKSGVVCDDSNPRRVTKLFLFFF